jgi:ech hydrogenase subunit F
MASLNIFKVVSSWAMKKPATRLYPFEKREPFSNTRGSIEIDVPKCSMCTLCAKKCPTEAIMVKRQEKIWEIDRLRCIQCSACVDACPKKCLTMTHTYSSAVTKHGVDTFIQEQLKTPPEKVS